MVYAEGQYKRALPKEALNKNREELELKEKKIEYVSEYERDLSKKCQKRKFVIFRSRFLNNSFDIW